MIPQLETSSDVFMTVRGKICAYLKSADTLDFRVSVFIFQYMCLFFYNVICLYNYAMSEKKKKVAFLVAKAHGRNAF